TLCAKRQEVALDQRWVSLDDSSALYRTSPGSFRRRTLGGAMNSSGNPVWARPLEEPIPCPECGSTSRVTRGLCLNCLLHQGFGDDAPTDETLENLLAQVDLRDPDRRLGNYQILGAIGQGGM